MHLSRCLRAVGRFRRALIYALQNELPPERQVPAFHDVRRERVPVRRASNRAARLRCCGSFLSLLLSVLDCDCEPIHVYDFVPSGGRRP